MINKIKVSDNAELIFSKDECGYNEVINDLKNANIIKIVTFNISAENSNLLNEIKKLKDTTQVEVISNIPNRYATYYSEAARKRAKKNIESYTEQLNPEKFSPMVSSYFNFTNHSKIILTENVAYIGSANASDESNNNFEGGVIIKDRKIISEIINTTIPMIKEDSIEYYGNEISRYIILVLNLLTRVKRIKEQFHFSFYKVNDHRGADIEYYDSYNADVSPILIEEIEGIMYEYEDIINELHKNGDIDIDDIKKNNISHIIDIISELIDFSNYDVQVKSSEYLEEYSYIAYEENLDEYAQLAFERANNEKIELADEVENTVIEIEKELDCVFENIKNLYDCIIEYKELNEKIDNT
ncbi:phospholipase D-like domain-containing protein [Clostridium drakei]|uniref:PLD phosphodiesterase domain-containing protein n=1 Tax=Clostridium drakei TaxID=332101 RepID=A0A2U8DVV0_9CLOT|nr:phospholipase D-like domain-containing protein [Clostridium drakei]AWI06760.1 hypothetical protein B9W14_20415 [Clostridium drakei]